LKKIATGLKIKMEENEIERLKKLNEKEKQVKKSPIQKIDKIFIPAEKAKEEWKAYNELLKTRKDKQLKVMKEAMYYAKQGKYLVDIYDAIKKAGLNKNHEPRFAIARADLHEVFLEKQDTGTVRYCMERGWNRRSQNDDVQLPQNIFNIQWERRKNTVNGITTIDNWQIDKKELKTKVPIIPSTLVPAGQLSSYYILWEVKEWEKLPEMKDPFLLKRISENLFAVLGSWDITELERAIMGGLK
jgi:hypothetical protein